MFEEVYWETLSSSISPIDEADSSMLEDSHPLSSLCHRFVKMIGRECGNKQQERRSKRCKGEMSLVWEILSFLCAVQSRIKEWNTYVAQFYFILFMK